MATAKIIPVGLDELELLSELYNDVFSPGQDAEFFRRRFKGRHNVSILLAQLQDRHVGFVVGFELMPTTYFVWLCGVLPDFRRAGVAIQLMHGEQAWAKDNGYHIVRFECQNQHRPMMHTAITEGYDLIGVRWDTITGNNVVIFEKDVG